MKPLEIKNYSTCPFIMDSEYSKDMKIRWAHHHAVGNGGQYIYRFVNKDGTEMLAIAINRKPVNDKYTIRGKHYRTGKYSTVYKITKEQMEHKSHVRYVFNKIIYELCWR